MSNQTQEAMSQIFKLISDKETSKLGLAKLYEFKVMQSKFHVLLLLFSIMSLLSKLFNVC